MSGPELEYSYDGWLVFNGLFTTEYRGEGDRDVDEIISSFDGYEGGKPAEPEFGFRRLPIEQDLAQLDDLSPQLTDLAERLRAFRYIDEDWVERWGYDENANEELFYLDNHEEIDVFWDIEKDAMMLLGDKALLNRKMSQIRGALSSDLKLDPVEFDYDFFLWLLYKEYEGQTLDAGSNLRIRKMTRGETVESAENRDSRIKVEGKDDILKSVVMIVPVLEGEKIQGLQGNFILGTKQIEVKMKFGGKVHVLVTGNPMSSWEDARQMGTSVAFLSELIKLYRLWEDLDSDNKYPPPSFFDDLRDSANDEGWKLRFDPKEVKQEYARKRTDPDEASDEKAEAQVGE